MFHYIWVSTNFLLERLSHDFLSKFFRLTEQKKFVGEPLFLSQNFWYGKHFWRMGGRGSIGSFCRKVFVSLCRKIS